MADGASPGAAASPRRRLGIPLIRLGAAVWGAAVVSLLGCSSPVQPTESSGTPSPSDAQLEGTFDVGGYSLYLTCRGTGTPTVLYFHGSHFEPGDASSSSAATLPALIRDKYRFCAYDRVNVGRSDDRPDIVSGTEAVRGLHELVEAAAIEPPYVLLGASFGGLLAYQYLRTHPEEVEGMLLLDAAFPDELTLERFFPVDERLESVDWSESQEKLNQLLVYEETMAMRGNEPAVPVTYLRAIPETWTLGIPEYDAVILDRQAAYVESFPNGVLKEVESPHYMEAAVPDRIVSELESILARTDE